MPRDVRFVHRSCFELIFFRIALYDNFIVITVWLEQVIVSGKLRA